MTFTISFQDNLHRQTILVRGLGSACSLINDVKNSFLPQNRLTFYPRQLFSKLFVAVIFLFHLFVSTPSISQMDGVLAIQTLDEALEIDQLSLHHR